MKSTLNERLNLMEFSSPRRHIIDTQHRYIYKLQRDHMRPGPSHGKSSDESIILILGCENNHNDLQFQTRSIIFRHFVMFSELEFLSFTIFFIKKTSYIKRC